MPLNYRDYAQMAVKASFRVRCATDPEPGESVLGTSEALRQLGEVVDLLANSVVQMAEVLREIERRGKGYVVGIDPGWDSTDETMVKE
jgi:hypothetical protein